MQVGGRHPGPRPHFHGRADRLFHCLGAAQPAAGSACEIASPTQQLREPLAGNADAHFDGFGAALDFDGLDLARVADEPFAHGEPDCVVLEICGAGKHHHVRNAVIDQRDRYFFSDPVGGLSELAALPALHGHFGAGWRRNHACVTSP